MRAENAIDMLNFVLNIFSIEEVVLSILGGEFIGEFDDFAAIQNILLD